MSPPRSAAAGPGKRWSRRSSARPSSCSPGRAASPSFLRRKLLEERLGGPSLPLDIGYSDTVPAGIRNAVRLRGRHCEWAGGCSQPAAACQVHHTKHKANGGKTSLTSCVLLCHYHHQVMIHRLGWTLVVNPDGTTTAWNKDKTKVLHSHGPPARAWVTGPDAQKTRYARNRRHGIVRMSAYGWRPKQTATGRWATGRCSQRERSQVQ